MPRDEDRRTEKYNHWTGNKNPSSVINYLKIAEKQVGLLINFNALRLKDGFEDESII